MSETATVNTRLINTLTQIILTLTDEERDILLHQLLDSNLSSESFDTQQEILKQETALGIQQLQAGQYTEYNDDSLPELFRDITQRGRQRLNQERS